MLRVYRARWVVDEGRRKSHEEDLVGREGGRGEEAEERSELVPSEVKGTASSCR